MLASALGDRIRSDKDGTLIVAVDGDITDAEAYFSEQLDYPLNLTASVGQSHVLGFGGAVRNGGLSFRDPAYWRGSQPDNVTRSGAALRIAGPVRVRVGV